MAKFSKIIRESNENLLINKFIDLFKERSEQKLKNSKRLSFVLTGGKSPIKLYKKLANTKKIDWKNVDFFIGDERYIKETSKNSNIKLCKKYLLNRIKIPKNQIFKIPTNSNCIKKDVNRYKKKIKNYFLNKKVSFDILLLGIGNDGHIASLFSKNIKKKNNLLVDHVKKKDFSRITLSIDCINSSKNIFLWAPGRRKKIIIKKILSDKSLKYPASYLKRKNNILFNCN
jgi:6-phosphogluconolactonase